MPNVRWVLSLLIVYHLAALGTAAIQSPDALTPITEVRHPDDDPIASVVTPMLDRAGMLLSDLEPILFRVSAPVRDLTRPYINAGLGGQQWNMFSSPYTEDKYVRLDYHIVTDRDPLRPLLLRELVLPADHEERVRLFHQFRDKVILNTLETYFIAVARDQSLSGGARDPREDETRRLRAFQPIVRYFADRLARTLSPGERLVRTELWYGAAPIPTRGHKIADAMLTARLGALAPFRQGPAPVAVPVPARYRQRGAFEREADVEWVLTYIEGPIFTAAAASVP